MGQACSAASAPRGRERLRSDSDEAVELSAGAAGAAGAAAAAVAQVDEAVLAALLRESDAKRFLVREDGDTLLIRAMPAAAPAPAPADASPSPETETDQDAFRGDPAPVVAAAMSGDFPEVARLLRGRRPDDALRAQLAGLLLGSRRSLRGVVGNLRALVCGDLIERTKEASLALLAALSGEHTLLLGPPGTAKSMLAARLKLAFHRPQYFERLLTRFSVPEELFGPLSVKALEQDRYERLVTGYLPCASVAFVDEIFKANSAILNSLLTILNERRFDNGTARVRVPLIALVGASNELPNAAELGALFDRFLVRMWVDVLSDGGFVELLDFGRSSGVRSSGDPLAQLPLSEDDVRRLQQEASAVRVPADTLALIRGYRAWLRSEGIYCSDRRWLQIVKLLKMTAHTNGGSEVTVWDCMLLQHLTWTDNTQRGKMAAWYRRFVGIDKAAARKAALASGVARLRRALEAKQTWVSAPPAPAPLAAERSADHDEAVAAAGDDEHAQMELARQLSAMEAEAAAAAQAVARDEPRLVDGAEVAQKVGELEALREDIAAAHVEAEELIAQLRAVMADHVWLGPVHGPDMEAWIADVRGQLADIAAVEGDIGELVVQYQALPCK